MLKSTQSHWTKEERSGFAQQGHSDASALSEDFEKAGREGLVDRAGNWLVDPERENMKY